MAISDLDIPTVQISSRKEFASIDQMRQTQKSGTKHIITQKVELIILPHLQGTIGKPVDNLLHDRISILDFSWQDIGDEEVEILALKVNRSLVDFDFLNNEIGNEEWLLD